MRDFSTFKQDQAALQIPPGFVRTVPNGPLEYVSPETVSFPEDAGKIVAYVAHRIFESEWEWSKSDLLRIYPALVGLTDDQVRQVLYDALA